jgi:hypothetical protein
MNTKTQRRSLKPSPQARDPTGKIDPGLANRARPTPEGGSKEVRPVNMQPSKISSNNSVMLAFCIEATTYNEFKALFGLQVLGYCNQKGRLEPHEVEPVVTAPVTLSLPI